MRWNKYTEYLIFIEYKWQLYWDGFTSVHYFIWCCICLTTYLNVRAETPAILYDAQTKWRLMGLISCASSQNFRTFYLFYHCLWFIFRVYHGYNTNWTRNILNFSVLRLAQKSYTHMKTSPLPMRTTKFRLMLRAGRDIYPATAVKWDADFVFRFIRRDTFMSHLQQSTVTKNLF
jgi:hypothetical protein